MESTDARPAPDRCRARTEMGARFPAPRSRIRASRRVAATMLLLVASVAISRPALSASQKSKAPMPIPAPDFSLPTRAGEAVTLSSLKGKVVLVDFWASWCEPCKKSFPWLKKMNDRLADKGFAVVAINLDKDRDKAEGFLQDRSIPFAVAFDPAGKTAQAFRVPNLPSSFLIDRAGQIVATHSGFDPKNVDDWEKRIKQACKP